MKQRRVVFLGIAIFSLFAILIVQFFKIQIVQGERWSEVADRQHFFVVEEPFRRGTFWSNPVKPGHPDISQKLVFDIQKFHLYADPDSIPARHKKEVAEEIAQRLGLDEGKVLSEVSRKSRSRKLSLWLDPEVKQEILQWWRPFAQKRKIARNALYFVSVYERSYPFGKLLGQVLHTIQKTRDETTKQAIPTGGLELSFNEVLTGKLGSRRRARSPRNAFETGEVIEPPIHGGDVYLTINHYLQAIVEEEVANGVKRSGAKSGWAVMMEPSSGEILALAQYPSFYPPDYAEYYLNPETVSDTKVKAVTDAYEPGSTMKPITLAVGLQANQQLKSEGKAPVFDPSEMMETADGKFPGRRKPLRDTHLHRYLNMFMALQKSSNIYMARMVEKVINTLGNDFYRSVLTDRFGFGLKTGVELPAESSGVLPTPGKKHPSGALEWSKPTPYSLAIGHNIQTTSVQMLRAYGVLANGGYLVQPTLVRKIIKGDAEEKLPREKTRVLDDEVVAEVIRAMKYVTKAGGSARRANVGGYTEAGKTGTARKIINGKYSNKHHVASIVGFTPVENPAFVLLVVMDEPEVKFIPGVGNNHHGGVAAAPVFRKIAARTLSYLGVAPDDPFGYPISDPRFDPEKADWALELKALKEKYQKWNIPSQ